MKRVLMVLAVVALLGWGFAGCGGDAGSEEAEKVLTAMEIDDDAKKFFPTQHTCPVCGGEPIDPEIHADVDGARLYFDKQECLSKFNSDQAKYVKEYRKKMQTMFGGGSR